MPKIISPSNMEIGPPQVTENCGPWKNHLAYVFFPLVCRNSYMEPHKRKHVSSYNTFLLKFTAHVAPFLGSICILKILFLISAIFLIDPRIHFPNVTVSINSCSVLISMSSAQSDKSEVIQTSRKIDK